MGNERDKWIAARAYQLWENAGKPVGQDSEHWSEASAEWDSRGGQLSQQTPAAWDDEES